MFLGLVLQHCFKLTYFWTSGILNFTAPRPGTAKSAPFLVPEIRFRGLDQNCIAYVLYILYTLYVFIIYVSILIILKSVIYGIPENIFRYYFSVKLK